MYQPAPNFTLPLPAILLTGGKLKNLPASEPAVPSKGFLPLGSKPLSVHTLAALKACPQVGPVIVVSPLTQEELGPEWKEADWVVPCGDKLAQSLYNGLDQITPTPQPVLLVAGDLPFLTPQAVGDFITQASQYPENALWYAFVEKSVSEQKYPQLQHTYAHLVDGTFCGSGLVILRADAAQQLKEAITQVTQMRKYVFKLAMLLGFKTLWRLATRRLTIAQAEDAGRRLLDAPCKGLVSPYAESAYNIDNYETLLQARRCMPPEAACSA